MPFFADDQEDEDTNQQSQQAQNDGTMISSGQSGTIGGGGPVSSNAPTSSGRFTNLQKYLSANKETATNVGAGTQIAGQTAQQKQQTSQRIGQESEKTQQAQQAGRGLDYQADLGAQAQQASNLDQAQPIISALEARAKTQFTGPKEISAKAELQQKARNLQETADLAKTEGGRFALLKNTFGKPSYNQGQQRLDQLLVQSDPTQQRQLQGLRKISGALGQELKGAEGTAAQRAQELEQQATETREKTLADVTGAGEGVNQSLAQRVAEFNANEAARSAAARSQAVDLASLGIGGLEAGWNPDVSVYQDPAASAAALARTRGNLQQLTQEMTPELGRAFGTYSQSSADISNIDPQRLAVMNALRRIAGQEEINPASAQAQQGKYGVITGGELDTEKNLNVLRNEVQKVEVQKEQLAPERAIDFGRAIMGQMGTRDEIEGRLNVLRNAGIDPGQVFDQAQGRVQEKLRTWGFLMGEPNKVNDPEGWNKYTQALSRARLEGIQEVLPSMLAQKQAELTNTQRNIVRGSLQNIAARRG